MAGKNSTKGSKSIVTKGSVENLATILENDADRLAGVTQILDNIMDTTDKADSLGLLMDVVHEVNDNISEVAFQMRHGRKSNPARETETNTETIT
jgi:hypothetical protein